MNPLLSMDNLTEFGMDMRLVELFLVIFFGSSSTSRRFLSWSYSTTDMFVDIFLFSTFIRSNFHFFYKRRNFKRKENENAKKKLAKYSRELPSLNA
jgi:hypothetical protein